MIYFYMDKKERPDLTELTPAPEREEKFDDLIRDLDEVGGDEMTKAECQNAANVCRKIKELGYENVGSAIDAINSGRVTNKLLLLDIAGSDFALNTGSHSLVRAAEEALGRIKKQIN